MKVAEPKWLTDAEQRAWRAFLEANRLLFEVLDRQLQHEAGIPHTYYDILVQLSEAPGRSLRMSRLAESTRSSRSRLSHAVDRLVDRGWIERLDCESDRRGQVAKLTDIGFAALAAAAPGHVAAVQRHMIERLTPSEVADLEHICNVILSGLEHDRAEVERLERIER